MGASRSARAEILTRFDTLWLEPFAQVSGLVTDLRFHRGFVEHVQMDARAFAEQAPRIYELAPIRHLTLTNVMAFPEALASPHLGRIASLEVSSQQLDDDALEVLARSPHARRLRWLSLIINKITPRGVAAICSSPHLKDVRYVSLRGNPVADPVDTYTSEGEAIISTERTELGRELEHRFGPQGWLHAPWFFGVAYPPSEQDAADS